MLRLRAKIDSSGIRREHIPRTRCLYTEQFPWRYRKLARFLPALLLVSSTALAQVQPAFDAASLKPADSAFIPGVFPQMKGGPGTADPGRITYTRQSLRSLLLKAWGIPTDQLSGPVWLMAPTGTDSFDLTATMPPGTTQEQFQFMLQGLLIERFRIKLHHEKRDFPGYELVVAPGGPKLKPTAQDPNAPSPDAAALASVPKGIGPDRFPNLGPGPRTGSMSSKGAQRAKYQDRTIAEFADDLGFMVNRSVGAKSGSPLPRIVDKTGLTARFDFTLEFDCLSCEGLSAAMRANMPLLAGRGGADPPAPEAVSDPGSGLPNIFNALEKQLGLRLVKVKDVPVDVIVVDQAEKTPTEN